VIDESYLRELVTAVERRDHFMYYDRSASALQVERLDELPEWLQQALRENVDAMCGLVARIGTRVGFRRIRERWHLVVNKTGALESACGVFLLDRPTPVRTLPPYQTERRKLCLRCSRAMIARELARLAFSPRAQERRA
jgi:hypothetical protein